jgi:uncharacterized protein (TIGR00661 family)
VITYGQSVDQLAGYDLIRVRGIKHFYDKDGRLSLTRSLFRNLGAFAYYATGRRELRRQLAEFSPDVAIVNFEPLVPRIARSLGVPIVSFDNQHALLHFPLQVPKGWERSAWITKTAIGLVVQRAEHYVIMALTPEVTGDPQVHVVPPVVQDEVRRVAPSAGSHVLVYLKRPDARFLDILRQSGEQFVIYGYNRATIDGNLTFRETGDRVHAELGACKAVMGTTGMSLTSEALWLKKPFFGVPLKNEFEQMWNATMVKRLDFGDFSEEPTRYAIDHFLRHLGDYRRSLDSYRFDSDEAGRTLLELIERLPGRATKALSARELRSRRFRAGRPAPSSHGKS